MRCRALTCVAAVPCHAARYCAVLCRLRAVLTVSYMPGIFRRSIIHRYRSASSAKQRRGVLCPAVRWGCSLRGGAVLRGSLPCCAVLRAMLRLPFRTCHVSFDEVSNSSSLLTYTTLVRTTLLNNKKSTPSSAQIKLSSAQHRVVRYAMRCHALRCRTALRRLLNTQYRASCEERGTRYRYVRVYLSYCFPQ